MLNNRAFIYTHLGLGDMFLMNGAVRFLRERYEEVYVVSKPKYEDTVKSMYSDDPNIRIVVADDADLHPWEQTSRTLIEKGYDVYGCGAFSMKLKKALYDYPNSFYDDMDIPRSARRTHFRVPRTAAGKALHESFQGRSYIVVHQEASTHTLPIVERLRAAGETRLIVDLNRNQVDPLADPIGHALAANAIFKSFVDYAQLLEGAEELHLIDSSVFNFTMSLDISKVRRRVYYIRPRGHPIDNFGAFEAVTNYM